MTPTDEPPISHLSPASQRGVTIYREKLRPILEPEHNGEAVAIHVGTGDYTVARSHTEARRTLLERHEPDGLIVTLTIGPPTPTDIDMASRFLAGQKQ